MRRNGRGIGIVVALTLIFSVARFALVSAQDGGSNVELTQNAEAEYVTVHNTGSESYTLSGLTLSFDDGQTEFTFDDGVGVAPGETVTVGTGTQTEAETDYNAGYHGYLLNNTVEDTVRLLDGDTVVASTADDESNGTVTTETSTVTTTTATATATTTPTATATTTEATTTSDETTTTTSTTTDGTTTTTDDGMTTTTTKDC